MKAPTTPWGPAGAQLARPVRSLGARAGHPTTHIHGTMDNVPKGPDRLDAQ